MNYRIILRTLGWVLLFEAIFFLVPLITALAYTETTEIFVFLVSIAICACLGWGLTRIKPKTTSLYAQEGFVIVALSWVLMSIFGAIPFTVSGAIPSYLDALFETISGFTTTGSTILSGEQIEGMSRSLLMWRSFTHWVGGMGVIVFVMVFLNLSGGRSISLLRAESPGPEVSKLAPKTRSTAGILYLIYTVLTVAELVFLLFGGVSFYESLNIAFSTAGTGGFGIYGDSLSRYSAYTQIVVTVFMLLFSVNFASYFFLLRKRFKEAFNEEVRVFLVIVATAIVLVSLNLCLSAVTKGYTVGEAIRHAAFTVASLVSTTGFATEDFNLWPAFSQTVLVLLMFVGACAGSTGGGFKVSRIVVLTKSVGIEMKHTLHPRQVKKIMLDKRVVEHEVVRGINAYLIAYIVIYILSMLIISLNGFDFTTNFTAVVATLNNIGPGLNVVGPTGGFADFSVLSKLVFMFDMLAGRLEIFPILLLFAPSTWRK